jgi:hypothetical protein
VVLSLLPPNRDWNIRTLILISNKFIFKLIIQSELFPCDIFLQIFAYEYIHITYSDHIHPLYYSFFSSTCSTHFKKLPAKFLNEFHSFLFICSYKCTLIISPPYFLSPTPPPEYPIVPPFMLISFCFLDVVSTYYKYVRYLSLWICICRLAWRSPDPSIFLQMTNFSLADGWIIKPWW